MLNSVMSQQAKLDTVKVQGRSFIVLGDSSLYVPNDTLLVLPDIIARRMILDRGQRSADFYVKLKNSFYKRKFTKELYDLLFKDPEKKKSTKKALTGNDSNKIQYVSLRRMAGSVTTQCVA